MNRSHLDAFTGKILAVIITIMSELKGFLKHAIPVLLLICLKQQAGAQNLENNQPYFFYPESYNTLHYSTVVGLSITKLPIALVEDQINTAPMLKLDFRMGISQKTDVTLQFYTNYVANLGSVGFQWSFFYKKLALAIGENTSVWFGHLELESVRLKSMGVVISPTISVGYNSVDFTFTSVIEVQSSYMKTLSHDILLGEFFRPFSAYSFKFIIEQPLWDDQWVALEIKLNYAKFYYQSWLTYSTIDEFFFYPEFSFGFIL